MSSNGRRPRSFGRGWPDAKMTRDRPPGLAPISYAFSLVGQSHKIGLAGDLRASAWLRLRVSFANPQPTTDTGAISRIGQKRSSRVSARGVC